MVCTGCGRAKGVLVADILCLSTVIACVFGLIGADHHSSTRVHRCSGLGLVRSGLHGGPAHTQGTACLYSLSLNNKNVQTQG